MESKSQSYLVIARKYRPQTFDEVVGQDPIATTLKNAIRMKRIGHAYLFTGPRGVGKTSMARIFAKALNCKSGPTVTPCGECPACAGIESGRSLDVLEIDGASNRGIDEIRSLRENVRFSPAAGKFKIYIIDEVHQITTDGFNALLKTLEEPPAHVKFIFATTSAQKVPATILSRCQRFDFRRISAEAIVKTLKDICKKEKIKIDEEALFSVARAADGSLRDSQSILDQIASSTDGEISRENVTRSLGALEEERLVELIDSLADHDAQKALRLLDGVLKEGKDPVLFLERLLEHVRNLLFLHVSEKLSDLVDAGESYKKSLLKQKEKLGREELFYFFSVITHTLFTMKRFEMKQIPLEVALIKLAHRAPMENISELLEKLRHPERASESRDQAGRSLGAAAPLTPVPVLKKSLKEEKETPDVEELPAEDISLETPAPENRSAALYSIWETLLRYLRNEKISVASYLAEGTPVGLKDYVATVTFPQRHNFHKECLEVPENKKLIEKHLSQLLEQEIRVNFFTVKDAEVIPPPVSSAEGGPIASQSKETGGEMNAAIESAMNIFGGKVIR